MEKPDRGSQGSKLDDSPNVEVTEQMVDEPQKQEDPHSQVQDQMAEEIGAETSNEMSASFQGSAKCESDEIQQKVERYEETMQKIPEVPSGLSETEHEAVSGKCQQPGTSQMSEGAAAKEDSEPANTVDCTLSIGTIIDEVMSHHKIEPRMRGAPADEGTKALLDYLNKLEDVPEVEGGVEEIVDEQPGAENMEQGEQPQQELQVEQARQSVELVPEEAVISDVKQEPMEEAEDIEEP